MSEIKTQMPEKISPERQARIKQLDELVVRLLKQNRNTSLVEDPNWIEYDGLINQLVQEHNFDHYVALLAARIMKLRNENQELSLAFVDTGQETPATVAKRLEPRFPHPAK